DWRSSPSNPVDTKSLRAGVSPRPFLQADPAAWAVKCPIHRKGAIFMQVCILMGSPRKNGNTNALRLPFQDELEQLGHTVTAHWLYGLDIRPCTACRTCQRDWSGMSCAIRDDVPALAEEILHSDLLVLATPIYSWYCTPPMKALLDRLVYGLCKYYGEEKGPSDRERTRLNSSHVSISYAVFCMQ